MLNGSSLKKADYIFLFCFIVLFILSVFINWNILPLDGEEPRRALVSIEMLQSGNYIMPTVFGWDYYNKPPVFNWIQSFLMHLTGSTKEWAVRLPSLLFLLIWAFFHYWLSKKFFPKRIAILSALFLLTNFHLFFYALGIGGEIDIFYSFLVYMQIMLLFFFNDKQKWLQVFIWSYIFCALGFLTKGFTSLAFQAFTLVALCAFNKSIKIIFRWQHLIGLLAFCILVGGYLYAFSFYSSPKWLLINLINESLLKSAVGENSERLWIKFFTYPFSFLKLLLPWSFVFLLLLKKHGYRLKEHSLVWFSILFITFNIWIYAFTGRPLLRYVYMFIPFAYNIVLYIFWKANEESPQLIKKIFGYAKFIFAAVLIVLIALPFFEKVSFAWVCLFVLLVAAFAVFYHKTLFNRIWLLCLGFVLLRFIYASIFIPVQQRLIKINYRNVAATMVAANDFKEIRYWSEPEPFNIGLDLKHWKWSFTKITSPPFVYYQLPYYCYYQSGLTMQYDTIISPKKTYLSYRSKLNRKDVSVFWSWYDVRQKAEFVLFRLK